MASTNVAGLAGQAPNSVGTFPFLVGPVGGGGGGPAPPASGINYVVKQSDQAQSNNTVLTNDNDLKLANVPAGSHGFQCWLDWTESGSTPNAKFAFGGGSAAQGGGYFGPSGGAPSQMNNQDVTATVAVTLSAIQLRGGVLVDGYFTMAAQGTFILTWAQNTSSAQTLTLKAGSWLMVFV